MMARAGMRARAGAAGGGRRGAAAQDRIHLHTNEAEIGEALRDGGSRSTIRSRCSPPCSNNLPERVQVYPTENYYYFRFTHNGVRLCRQHPARRRRPRPGQGAFRLQRTADRLEQPSLPSTSRRARGGAGRRRSRRSRPLDYRGRAWRQDRHLRAQRPVAGASRRRACCSADETFLGPVFDESGIRFFLVFNSRLKVFHYLLDETAPVADQFVVPQGQSSRS